MSKFSKEWEGTGRKGIRSIIKPQQPLRSRLELVVRRIETQAQAIDGAINRFNERDRTIFSKVVDAYVSHDTKRANAYANELAEIRKMASFLMGAKLALERVVLRLSTVSQLGNVVTTLAPAIKVLQGVRTGISGILPNAEQELGAVAQLLDEIMIEAGTTTGVGFDVETVSEDAAKILNEAAIVAEQRMKGVLPEPALKASAEVAEQTEYRSP